MNKDEQPQMHFDEHRYSEDVLSFICHELRDGELQRPICDSSATLAVDSDSDSHLGNRRDCARGGEAELQTTGFAADGGSAWRGLYLEASRAGLAPGMD